MKSLSVQLENGPTSIIDLCEGDHNFLIIEFRNHDSEKNSHAFLTRREAEWFKKLLDMHLDRDDYDNND